jgi:hypothetical protein
MDRAIIRYIILLIWLTYPAQGEIRKVPVDYPTIQAAIDASIDGDIVLVTPGTYTGDGNRDIDFKGKAITVKSEAGPETCIIDCQGGYYVDLEGFHEEPHRGFYFHSGEDARSTVQGVTIRNGYIPLVWNRSGGGIYCYQSSPSIKNCIITENIACFGGGISCYDSNSVITNCIIRDNLAAYPPYGWFFGTYGSGGGVHISRSNTTFVNCLITGNKTIERGGGVYCEGHPGNLEFINCTISGNMTGERGMGGGVLFGSTSKVKAILRNSIVWKNKANFGQEIALISDLPILGMMRVEIKHSLIGSDPNSVVAPKDHLEGQWLTVDPLFSQSGYWDTILRSIPGIPGSWRFLDYIWFDGDYHLKSQAGRWDPNSQTWVKDDVTSPCIDAGDPNSPIGDEPFPNGGIINMGAYGGTAEASKSYFGEPVCETIVAGDINGDCKVDLKDLAILASHWLEQH